MVVRDRVAGADSLAGGCLEGDAKVWTPASAAVKV